MVNKKRVHCFLCFGATSSVKRKPICFVSSWIKNPGHFIIKTWLYLHPAVIIITFK